MPAKKSKSAPKKGAKKTTKKSAPSTSMLAVSGGAANAPSPQTGGDEKIPGFGVIASDGNVYFISDKALQTFALKTESAKNAVRQAVASAGQGTGTGITYEVTHTILDKKPDITDIII